MPVTIFKQFHFDAAHQLGANVPAAHKYARVHGHSFEVEVHFTGEPDPQTGWVCDLAQVTSLLDAVRGQLDHHYLNDIPGLQRPTLERIAMWIWEQVSAHEPTIAQVRVTRGSCQEGCIYTGPDTSNR